MASQREDGAVSLTDGMEGAAAINLATSSVAKGLVQKVHAFSCMRLGYYTAAVGWQEIARARSIDG
jgi:hypothetical protein